MFTDNLYQRLVGDAVQQGCDEVIILAGYVSSSFVRNARMGLHKERGKPTGLVVSSLPETLQLTLITGMYPESGINVEDAEKLKSAHTSGQANIYLYNPSKTYLPRAIHSKVYVWMKAGRPVRAFLGSANATVAALFSSDREAMAQCDVNEAYQYVRSALDKSESILDVPSMTVTRLQLEKSESPSTVAVLDTLEFVNLPLFVVRTGEVHDQSGLNWGQRGNRNRNEAYLPVPSGVSKSGFFPPRGVRFFLFTTEGDSWECAICQQGGKAIHTVESNAILGEYFRRKLGLSPGQYVHRSDLDAYGRTSVRVYKTPDANYILEF